MAKLTSIAQYTLVIARWVTGTRGFFFSFHEPHNMTDVDVSGRHSQTDATSTSPGTLYDPGMTQVFYNFHKMIVRNALQLSDVPDGNTRIRITRQVDQHTESVVGTQRKRHQPHHP